LAVLEDIRGDDHMGCAHIQIVLSVVRMDAAADLHAAGVGAKGLFSSPLITLAKHDDVPAGQAVGAVHLRIVSRRALRYVILYHLAGIRLQGLADNLFDLSFM